MRASAPPLVARSPRTWYPRARDVRVMDMDEREIRERMRALEKSLPKARKPPLRPPVRRKAAFFLRLQAILTLILLSALALLTLLPPFYWPVRAPVTSDFLFRLSPDSRTKGLEIHHGIDLGAPAGTPILASGFGIVEAVGSSPALGNYVVVNHFFGFSSTYAHMSSVSAKKGGVALPGLSRLGLVGSTGRSTGPHLHFAVSFLGIPLPPRLPLAFHSLRLRILKF